MRGLGVHFALADEDVAALRALADEVARPDFVSENIEERYFTQHKDDIAQSDKAWDALHRSLAGGMLTWDGGVYPLNHAVLAGELLYTQDDYIMSLKAPEQVRDIAAALEALTQDAFRKRYFAIDRNDFDMDLSDEDFVYTWETFKDVRSLYCRAATQGRHVLFTADQ